MNIIRKAYQALDDSIMDCVNAGVRAWNWTTGRTKSDLASLLVYSSPMPFLLREGFMQQDSFSRTMNLLLTTGFYFIVAPVYNGSYKNTEKEEINAIKSSLKNIDVENTKENYKLLGSFYALAGSLILLGGKDSLGFASLIMGSSLYVARADILPPRMDCVSRGLEKIAEHLRKPATQKTTI